VSLKSAGTTRAGAVSREDVTVPGSVANLGGGFDTLGVAVELYLRARVVEVREDGAARLQVSRSAPAIPGDNAVERAFGLAARRTGRPAPSVTVEVESDIPMAAGLGSSAAATVAGLRIFERVTAPLDEATLLAVAVEAEGHADNAAPALFGGLVSVVDLEGGGARALRWRWPPDLRIVVGTPTGGLTTARARAALPATVSRTDAVFNMQRVLALVHALQERDYTQVREAVRDRLHQGARARLVPQLVEALAVEDAEVIGTFLSGAGPSIAMLAREASSGHVARLLRALYERSGVTATVRELRVHEASAARPPGREERETMKETVATAPGRTA
jgi:homoserine kinase